MSDISGRTEINSVTDTDALLTPLEAALHLGITPELLFFYTSKSFQKASGLTRRLEARSIHGETLFSRAELDSFDNYLQKPWTDVGQKRREVPQKILAYLAAESCGACIRCRAGVGVETAHIEAWATSRSNHHHNLLRICSSCHSEHDLHQSLSTEELRKLKAVGIERLRAQLKLRMRAGDICPAPAPDPLFFGHAAELSILQEALRTDRFVLVLGPGGIGKTQLTLQALSHAKTSRAVIWINVERYGDIDGVRTALEVAICERTKTQYQGDFIEQLDAVHACLVLDGIENFKGPALDAIDDWICQIQARTVSAQILVTSQVDLQRAYFDHQIFLHGIDGKASRDILKKVVRPGTPFDHQSQDAIISFSDGHPLTLRLAATLVNFFGSGRNAYDQIMKRGVALLKVQKRAALDKYTSLDACLSLAYDALNLEEKKILFLVSNAPGGFFSAHLERGVLEIDNGREVIAGIRRWSLVRIENPGEGSERLYVLSPIANYVISRWETDSPKEAQELTKKVAIGFGVMAAVIDSRSGSPDEIPYMLTRFKLELPNLLRVFDFSERHPTDSELSLFTSGICSALMRYFFVLRLGDSGSRVMLRGARIALRDGKPKRASDLIAQMIGLMARNDSRLDLDIALGMLDEIERQVIDAETRGNISLCRALCSRMKGDIQDLEFQARTAISHLEEARAEHAMQPASHPEHPPFGNLDGIENDISSSFGLLGDALLAKRLYSESATAYRTALSFLRGAAIAVNDGQLYHQLGNCESCLGRHEAAASCYITAAKRFHEIGMREFLSNALGELGHTLLDIGSSRALLALPEFNLITDGLADVENDLVRSFSIAPFNLNNCANATRKLFGLVVLASLSKKRVGLGKFSAELISRILEPAAESVIASSNDGDKFAFYHLERLLLLAASIEAFEQSAIQAPPSSVDIEDLAKVCHHQGPWADLRRKSFEWLSLYLRHRWDTTAGTGVDLQLAADRAAAGEGFTLPGTA